MLIGSTSIRIEGSVQRRSAGVVRLIRRRGDTLLRTFTRNAVPVDDTDREIAALWFNAVWPKTLFRTAERKARKASERSAGGRR
jgi:hypothetical protein